MDILSNKSNLKKALKQQQNEINDYTIYKSLAFHQKDENNKKIFEKIANEEKNHYDFWVKITNQQLKAQKFIVLFYIFLVKIFGTSFALKTLEKREAGAEEFYKELFDIYPESKNIYKQETEHEFILIDMLHDKKLIYAGAIVLGMNDALVELTGTLSGLAFAFDKSIVVGITGLIMGIAASLSMAGSAYLEAKENPSELIKPLTYSTYTGIAYILTTAILVSPFFIFDSIIESIILMFICAFIAIVSYNFYISVAKDLSFTKRVLQMSAITFGVAIISFLIGYLVKHYFGIDI
ncbi:VIT1/CCC1 transporter family protein [Aliarcobacter vitoriensis]|uniref:Rubrerythrin family protein n=1 Tax=Aliarcobacter vitoriensis TaxID=2011099 RepID=A0A366MSI9_9BACT|nr:VIT1/CCC1 transporter family protein [Aliarcobacter vitoriensis]RBQ29205.1 rubrerythrin family protein [Aliarcobacter vitoriensis]